MAEKIEVRELETLAFDEEELRKPKDKYVPEGFDDIDEYFDDLRENYRLDVEADRDNRIAALDDKRFTAGEQWDPIVLQQRAGLPCLTINTLPAFISQLVGDWRENRNGIRVIANDDGQKDIADIRSDLIRSIQTKCRADRILDNTFESMVQCGDGAFRVAVQYANEDVFDQEIALGGIEDCLSVVWDRLSLDPTGRDANRCFVDDNIPAKEFSKKWPEHDPSKLGEDERQNLYNTGWLDQGLVKVTEHWRMLERHRLLGLFQDGSIHEIEGKGVDLQQLVQEHGPLQRSRLAPCRYAQMHLVTGYDILAGPYEYKINRLPIIRMSGRTVSVGDRRFRYGLIRFMKDAVRLRNFWRSVAAEQLGYAPKAQWMATEDAVEGKEDQIRKSHLSRDPLLVFNEGAVFGQNVQRVDPPQVQTALLQESQVNTQDMKDVSGIHDASLGVESNETSGRAIMARQREGDVGSLTYYDNGNAAILEAGDVINQLIPQIYDGTRIIRTIGEDETTKLVKINDPMDPRSPNLATGSYDVAITTGSSYTTRRVEAAEAMMEAIQVFPELMQIAGDLVVKAQDWPGSDELADRLRKTIPPQLLSPEEQAEAGTGGPNPQAMMQQQQQLQEAIQKGMQEIDKLQKENFSLKVKADIEAKKLEIEEFRAETERLNAYALLAQAKETIDLKKLEHNAHVQLESEEQDHDQLMERSQLALDANQQQFDQDNFQPPMQGNASSSGPASTQPSE